MSIKCIPLLEGVPLTDKEVQKIIDDVSVIRRLETQERVMREEVVIALNEKARQVKIEAHDEFLEEVQSVQLLEGVKSFGQFLNKRMKQLFGRDSIDTVRIKYRNRLLNKLNSYEATFGVTTGLEKIKPNSPDEEALFKKVAALGQMDLKKVSTLESADKVLKEMFGDNPTEIDRMALALASYNEYTRQFMIKHGVPVEFHSGYVVKRVYSPKILADMGKDNWVDFMAKRLDSRKTFGHTLPEAELKKKLHKIAGAIERNELKATTTLDFDFDGKPKFKRRREFVFKDEQAAYEVFRDLSPEGLTSQIVNSSWRMASEAVRISRLGYDPAKINKRINERAIDYVSRLPDGEKAKEGLRMANFYKENRIKQAIGDLTGENNYARSGVSSFGTALKVVNSVTKLGNSITVAMLDPLDASRQAFYVNGKPMGGFIDWHVNMASAMKNIGFWGILSGDTRAAAELNEHLALVTHYISTESSMRVARGELGAGYGAIGKRLERGTAVAMKLATLLPQQTALSKISTGLLGAKTFAGMIDKVKKGDKLNAFELDTLREYSISPNEMKVLGMVERYQAWGGNSIVSSKQIRALLEGEGKDYEKHLKEIADTLGIKESEVGDNIISIAEKYDNYLVDFFSRGTPTPELAAKTALFKGTNSEFVNVAMGLLTQFMDTPVMQLISYSEMIDKLKRVHAHPDGDVAKTAAQVGVAAMAQTVPHLLAGAGMYMAYDAIWSGFMGKESKIEKLSKATPSERNAIFLDIAGRTSAVPFLFEGLDNSTSEYYNKNLSSMFGGPSLDLVNDGLNVVNPNGNTTFEHFVRRHKPNAWFIQASGNHFFGD
jgi:hypothetical protein